MKIKVSESRNFIQTAKGYLRKYLKGKKFLFVILAVLIIPFVAVVSSVIIGFSKRPGAVRAKQEVISIVKKTLALENCKLPLYYIESLTVNPESIAINIKHKDFQKLAYIRELVLSGERASGGGNVQLEFVPATIDYKSKSIPVKIRLKGDRRIHYEDKNKWSFRVKTRKDNTLFGMKRFSLHKPGARNYIYEWLLHKVLKREGLVALRYKFINVVLNGKKLGVYALEEHFDKRLIENNQQREGPIIRFNEIWGIDFYVSPIEPLGKTETSKPESMTQLNKAISLLESFRQREMKTSEVFDVKKLATYFAVTDLLGTHHGSVWKSIRFFYNPVTSKLEPIGFDGHFGTEHGIHIAAELGTEPDATWLYKHYADWFGMLFNNEETFDEVFFEEYVRALERLSNPSYLDKLFADIDDELKENLALMYKDFPPYADHVYSFGPDIFFFSKKVFYQRQNYIRHILSPGRGMHAYYKESSSDGLILELGNIQKMPLEIINVTYKGMPLPIVGEKRVLFAKAVSGPVNYQNVSFAIPPELTWANTMIEELKVNYRVLGTTRLRYEAVYPYTHLDKNLVTGDFLRQPSNLDSIAFLRIDEEGKKILIRPGNLNLDQNLTIPQGYRLVCGGDTKLNLSNSTKIVSYSPIEFKGSEQKPITIYSSDSTGHGIAVISAGEESVLEHVNFDNLLNPSQKGWELTGAVTFYESAVRISHCRFTNNKAEDTLNIIRSRFEIDDTGFSEALSDAFDADFCEGSITNCFFRDCGNDAIDVCGSTIEISQIVIDNAGDKGVSVGENSQMRASDIDIKNTEIAVASKDTSEIVVDTINVTDCNIGFASYQKKTEFGPAAIRVKNLNESNINVPYLIEYRPEMTVDGREIAANHENVRDILYGVEYGESSK